MNPSTTLTVEVKDATAATLIEHKAATSATPVAGAVADEHDPMVFDIIASVTGVVDEVKDIVVPGAFERTLAGRVPKVIKDHEWAKRLGRFLHIKELRPGDPGLPATLPDGRAWPAGAGALIGKVRLFNTPEGTQAAERWREDPEQQFSIGYVARKAVQRKDKVRLLQDVELLEVSDVLWGAMPLCGMMPGSLATKMLAAVADPGLEDADRITVEDDATNEAFEAALFRMAEDEIDWTAVEAATPADDADPGTPEPGDAPAQEAPPEGADASLQPADADPPAGTEPADADPPAGTVPEDDQVAPPEHTDHAEHVHQDLADGTEPGLPAEGKAAGGADKDRGNAEQLRRYWTTGPGAAKVAWGTPGDWQRCVNQLEKHMGVRAKGYCQLRHMDATGEPAGVGAHDGKKAAADLGLVDAGLTLGALAYDPTLEVGDYAGTKAADTVLQAKDYPRLPGTWEERQEKLRAAVNAALRGPRHTEDDVDSDRPTPAGRYEWDHVRIDGTWEDRVIATRCRWSDVDNAEETFELSYVYDGTEVTLGEPHRVQLQISVAASDRDEALLAAMAVGISDVTLAVKQLTGQAAVEGKIGARMSGANSRQFSAALEHLLWVAAAVGIRVSLPDDAPELGRSVDPNAVAPDSTSPTARGASPAAARPVPRPSATARPVATKDLPDPAKVLADLDKALGY